MFFFSFILNSFTNPIITSFPTNPIDLLAMNISSVPLHITHGTILREGWGSPPCSTITQGTPSYGAHQHPQHGGLVGHVPYTGPCHNHLPQAVPHHGGLHSLLLHVRLRHDVHLVRGSSDWDIGRSLWVLR
eukprot:TRINITY_DN27138_c1_g1_i1.p2 TRINITY_DN27138_c1_g1~~TRINITY_DN27138_c1_g1_i1.p2  ORF type:complete len:131 (+),score=14.76 TRINITY_DN27138_c1_g1_i1:1-393(+)